MWSLVADDWQAIEVVGTPATGIQGYLYWPTRECTEPQKIDVGRVSWRITLGAITITVTPLPRAD